ncbi:MAG: PqqD family protein [Caldilineae bacterium]|nr:MAG: PqqD family protein [Caldilineae bacterium]
MDRPKRNTDNLLIEDLQDELVLARADGEAVHVLNATARYVWTLCDGRHTIEDIVHALEHHFLVPTGTDLRLHVQRLLEDLAAKGLVHTSGQGAYGS